MVETDEKLGEGEMPKTTSIYYAGKELMTKDYRSKFKKFKAMIHNEKYYINKKDFTTPVQVKTKGGEKDFSIKKLIIMRNLLKNKY